MHLAQENPPREFTYLHIFTNLKWENLHFGHTLPRVDLFQISRIFLGPCGEVAEESNAQLYTQKFEKPGNFRALEF